MMSNCYSSMAARDHRPILSTDKHNPIDQNYTEGYEIMKFDANKIHAAVCSITPCQTHLAACICMIDCLSLYNI